MAIVHHPSSAGVSAAVDISSGSSPAESRSSLQQYRSSVRRWLESADARIYSRALRELARASVACMNYDDQSGDRLRAWHGYAETASKPYGGKRDGLLSCVSRSTAYRGMKALCGEVPGVPGIMTRRPARDSEIITRAGELIWEFRA